MEPLIDVNKDRLVKAFLARGESTSRRRPLARERTGVDPS
jgi:hypothetical protein